MTQTCQEVFLNGVLSRNRGGVKMTQDSLVRERAKMYQFLSLLYHDEISRDLVGRMRAPQFQKAVEAFSGRCSISDLNSGLKKAASYIKSGEAEALYKSLSYEYADIFPMTGKIVWRKL